MDEGVRERERVRSLVHLCGERRTETEHREWALRYRVDVARVYFSPRLATERMRVVEHIRSCESKPGGVGHQDHSRVPRVLDMFAGVGPFSILIARTLGLHVTAVDINPRAVDYLKANVALNNVTSLVTPICADALQFVASPEEGGGDYHYIIMNLPHTALEYLPAALRRLAKGGVVFLYAIVPRGTRPDAVTLPDLEVPVTPMEIHPVHPYSPKEDMVAIYLHRGH